ncbi:hypothetical protein SDC9_76900 [bioreactor metagenome]|uniref:Uncharacterized protein n=1 Tax=bioreactor metagenome TaxID=1076179 RepID=A0A644YNZ7_9ZZZZ
MRLHGDVLPQQLFPAQKHRAAPVGGKETVIVPAALPQPVPCPAAAKARKYGKIHLVRRQARTFGSRFQNSVCSLDQSVQGLHDPQLHDARLRRAQRKAQPFSPCQRVV